LCLGKHEKKLRKNNIPADATLMSDSGWECCATDTDGVYYRVKDNTVVLTQDYDNSFYNDSPNWIKLKEIESR
jgi:hypothetical protein